MAFFSGFQYGFWSSRSDSCFCRVARAFNRSWATRVVALDISKDFDKVCHAGLLHKLKSYGISSQIFGLIAFFSVIDDMQWFWMGSLHKNTRISSSC